MRDNGYKNTAYALAELIDNSFQAIQAVQELNDAYVGEIDVVVIEERVLVEQRERLRPTKIVVADNGCGMTPVELRTALQFGNGSHLEDRRGIGRFGMGLPNSTVSQCRRADVWTWRTGTANAYHSYLDLGMIESDDLVDVPAAEQQAVPKELLETCPSIAESESGTIVVWSDLDRVKWRTARSTVDNTEALIGRIYRKLLADGLRISLTTVSDGTRQSRIVRPNDPLYLMSPTSTPSPFDSTPMFQPWGKTGIQEFSISLGEQTHTVVVTLSYARDEARILPDARDPGNMPYGKHARENVGVSLVRADRELLLDTAWANRDLRERWWGAEIAFPPALDEVFGVTNNKQFATRFTEMSDYYRDDRNDDEWQEVRAAWEEADDPERHLVAICNYLDQQLDKLRAELREQTKGTRTKKQKRHDEAVETRATRAFKERAGEGRDAGDADLVVAPGEKEAFVESSLIKKRYAPESARELAQYVASKDLTVVFVRQDNPEAQSFFHVDVVPGVTEVVFNTAHPAFNMLIGTLDPAIEDETADQLRSRIEHASGTVKLLFAAWARYEAEEKSGERRDRLRDVRQDWGRMARAFLKDFQVESAPEDDASD